jgi:hypothetical protein
MRFSQGKNVAKYYLNLLGELEAENNSSKLMMRFLIPIFDFLLRVGIPCDPIETSNRPCEVALFHHNPSAHNLTPMNQDPSPHAFPQNTQPQP